MLSSDEPDAPDTPGAPDPGAPAKKKSRARKTSENPTRIYSYRVLPPENSEHRDLVEEQFWLAHRYRRRLIKIEIDLRARFREIDLDHPDTRDAYLAWEAKSKELDAAYAALRAAKAGRAQDQRDAERERVRADIKAMKAECGKAWKDVKSARALPHVVDHHAQAYAAAREGAADRQRAARGEFSAKGLMHGTYIHVEQAVQRSVDSTGRPPMFERYEGEGSIGRQLPRARDKSKQLRSVTAEDLYARKDSRVYVTRIPDGWENLARSARRRAVKPYRSVARKQRHGEGWQEIPARLNGHYLEVQFGWAPADRPSTWVRFPMTHHRRMPGDTEVLWVYIRRWRIGNHFEWRAQFTIESKTFRRPEKPTAVGGTCAIDIGWRRIFDGAGNQIGLRAGYLVDEHGTEREIRVPDGLWQRLARVYAIEQTRSLALDRIRERVMAWIKDREMPAWFTESRVIRDEDDGSEREIPAISAGMAQWRSPRKMRRLVDAWKKHENRIDGDGEILNGLLTWACNDRNFENEAAHIRDRAIANRREMWRRIAAELTRTYSTILVEDGTRQDRQMKITDVPGWEKKAPEDGDPHEGREQRRQARIAAPGELRTAIAQAAHKTASSVIDASPARKSTRECAWCGHVQKHADFSASIMIRCEGCGRWWDQDANASRNLLHRRGLPSGRVPPTP